MHTALTAFALVLALAFTGLCGAVSAVVLPAPAGCSIAGHPFADGGQVKVDAGGNAWTMNSRVDGPVRVLTCVNGSWKA